MRGLENNVQVTHRFWNGDDLRGSAGQDGNGWLDRAVRRRPMERREARERGATSLGGFSKNNKGMTTGDTC